MVIIIFNFFIKVQYLFSNTIHLGFLNNPNIGLTFKSAPERSEGLAWFVLFVSCTNHDKGFIRLKHVLG
ncbi:MAG: hypothetical protein ACE14V_03750, partial [bacterium]